MIVTYQTLTRLMTFTISRAGISGTDIQPDSPEWREWFQTALEGTKIQFVWTDDSFREQRFTAYRRKRYWEAQKRVSGKLRNTTIKPGEVTYEALRQMGLKLTAYNWADSFEVEESGKSSGYQTAKETPSLTEDEIEKLQAQIAELDAQLKERNQQLASAITQKEKLEGKAKAAEQLAIQQSKEISRLDTKLDEVLTQQRSLTASKSIPLSKLTLNRDGGYYQLRGKSVIYLEDLEKLGYQVK